MLNNQLRPEHEQMVSSYINEVANKKSTLYMLTISRDGESPARSIIYYSNAIEAAEAYNKYTDWGFAKNYLTVKLYEPNGIINEKVLKRNQAGECTFVKQDYIETEKILLKYKNFIEKEKYEELVKDFMILFSKDNWRFNPDRFLKECGIDKIAIE